MKKKYLFTPGPTTVPPSVLLKMAEPIIHHRTSEYRQIFGEVREGLRYIFRTENEVLTFASSGTGGMEAAVSNLFSSGDRALVVRGGKFGERFGELCEAFGVEAVTIDVEWGRAVRAEEIKKTLEENRGIKAVFVTLCETSTGVLNDIRAIAKVVSETSASLVVDAISALGTTPLETDKWQVDVVIAGSQKGLMVPPGLSFVSLSPKAWKLVEESGLPKYYFDFKKAAASQGKSDSPYTPAISLVMALWEALRLIREEGLDKVIERHALFAKAARAAVVSLGLRLVAESPSPSLTAVWLPEKIDGERLVKNLRGRYGVSIAGGQGKLKGKIFRLAHMGYVDTLDIPQMISAVEIALHQEGYAFEPGAGVGAALRCLQ